MVGGVDVVGGLVDGGADVVGGVEVDGRRELEVDGWVDVDGGVEVGGGVELDCRRELEVDERREDVDGGMEDAGGVVEGRVVDGGLVGRGLLAGGVLDGGLVDGGVDARGREVAAFDGEVEVEVGPELECLDLGEGEVGLGELAFREDADAEDDWRRRGVRAGGVGE